MVERRLRLRRESEVRQARNRGKAFADGPLVARILPNGSDPPQNRYAVIAGKKVGKAVQRNRLKRLVREAIRHLHPQLTPGHDMVIILRGGVDEMPGLATAEASLRRIVQRAGLLDPQADPPSKETPAEPVKDQP
jgi:ribonuclease P protein component